MPAGPARRTTSACAPSGCASRATSSTPTPSLPTLAAVLDDVRRLMEERGTLGLVYLDLGGDGQAEAAARLAGLRRAAAGLRARAGSLRADGRARRRATSSRCWACAATSSWSSCAGDDAAPLDAASAGGPRPPAARAARRRRCPRILATGVPQPADVPRGPRAHVPRPHAARGALHPPRAGRGDVHEPAAAHARGGPPRPGPGRDHRRRGRWSRSTSPSWTWAPAHVLGHEVFTPRPRRRALRGRRSGCSPWPSAPAACWSWSGCAARARSAPRHRHLQPGAKLFLNTSARALRDAEVAGAAFVRQVDAQGLRPRGRGAGDHRAAAPWRSASRYQRVLRELKREGFGIAIDDMGAGYSSLQALVEMEPDYLKFDISLVRQHRPQPDQAQPAGDAGGAVGEDRRAA